VTGFFAAFARAPLAEIRAFLAGAFAEVRLGAGLGFAVFD